MPENLKTDRPGRSLKDLTSEELARIAKMPEESLAEGLGKLSEKDIDRLLVAAGIKREDLKERLEMGNSYSAKLAKRKEGEFIANIKGNLVIVEAPKNFSPKGEKEYPVRILSFFPDAENNRATIYYGELAAEDEKKSQIPPGKSAERPKPGRLR